ncbi:valine--tRNA ligase [Desulfothermus okinawensis JCM 13304]
MQMKPLDKGYEPDTIEKEWIERWEKENTYMADPHKEGNVFSIVIPPPNVTGTLHMGHALNITLQDIMCRYKRQKGYNVLWVPGTDHAGIATQNVVERAIAREGLTREDLGREKFIERVWQWKEEYGGKILNQIKCLGASVDWSRLRFTMDEGLSKAVREVFVRLYNEGLIYKGDYMINWCPRCHTALADLEVEHEEKQGHLYYIKYPLESGEGNVVVATTRPETMLGDTAVCVNPQDERYKKLIGKKVKLPLTDRIIPIISDSYVDMEFGTGCLKVTPGHDPNDFELGRKHGLELVRVIDENGYMTEDAGDKFKGLDRFECRKKVVEELKNQGLLEKIEEITHSVGHCYRCKTVIEPLVSKQWFVKTKPLARPAKQAVLEGNTKFFPESWTKTYFEWLDNIRDWCISRQIWWGHRIPAWTCNQCGKLSVSTEDLKTCPGCGSRDIVQEEDVLDTWFSSALWPFSTLGWPDKTKELEVYYPTSLLVTGFDIIFFWVARMMMMGIHFMNEVPFRHVYIHALVRDEHGKKMSKSTGNVIDPLDMIAKYGADALRFTLTAFAAMGRDIKLSEARIEGYKHFINKIWNAGRFVLMNADDSVDIDDVDPKNLSFAHRYILHALEGLKKEVERTLEGYYFNESAQALYQFFWHTFCDWYLEMIKKELYSDNKLTNKRARNCLIKVFSELLILLHPFIPFITQHIYTLLPGTGEKDLSKVRFPEYRPGWEDSSLDRDMEFFQGVVVGVRNIKGEFDLNPGMQVDVIAKVDDEHIEFLEQNKEVISQLARIKQFEISKEPHIPKGCASFVCEGCEFYVPLEGVIDFQKELERLVKNKEKIKKELNKVENKLANKNFLEKAPKEIVEKEKKKKDDLMVELNKIESLIEKIKSFI